MLFLAGPTMPSTLERVKLSQSRFFPHRAFRFPPICPSHSLRLINNSATPNLQITPSSKFPKTIVYRKIWNDTPMHFDLSRMAFSTGKTASTYQTTIHYAFELYAWCTTRLQLGIRESIRCLNTLDATSISHKINNRFATTSQLATPASGTRLVASVHMHFYTRFPF